MEDQKLLAHKGLEDQKLLEHHQLQNYEHHQLQNYEHDPSPSGTTVAGSPVARLEDLVCRLRFGARRKSALVLWAGEGNAGDAGARGGYGGEEARRPAQWIETTRKTRGKETTGFEHLGPAAETDKAPADGISAPKMTVVLPASSFPIHTRCRKTKGDAFCSYQIPARQAYVHIASRSTPRRQHKGKNAKSQTSSRRLFRELMEAALEALGIGELAAGEVLADCDAGSQMLMVNCFPACPEPELTLGMPPHSDYGFLTVLLQDQVNGLEILHEDKWVLVDPLPGSLVVNIGDHFEIYSNGRYKSVLHRVRVNSTRPRISVASLHSLPPARVIGPAPELVDDEKNPRRYMDTDFATFVDYLSSAEGKHNWIHPDRTLALSRSRPSISVVLTHPHMGPISGDHPMSFKLRLRLSPTQQAWTVTNAAATPRPRISKPPNTYQLALNTPQPTLEKHYCHRRCLPRALLADYVEETTEPALQWRATVKTDSAGVSRNWRREDKKKEIGHGWLFIGEEHASTISTSYRTHGHGEKHARRHVARVIDLADDVIPSMQPPEEAGPERPKPIGQEMWPPVTDFGMDAPDQILRRPWYFSMRKWVSARPSPDAPRRLHLVELRPNAKGLPSLAQAPTATPQTRLEAKRYANLANL
ncbi:hypothetical protein HU200_047907 [Digitaria exilis]|uniref:Fe2OG dioxygenase domain-containing protein n=1 Tax=Digitaria exilis TaxID=1010633 RepID=A0A835AWA6_9POAL|nr:hypothetical protein HU200_047907 [Digitaria exilis]